MIMNLSPIQMEWFYHLEGEKTKLNWYLLELALEYYECIRTSPALAAYREQYDEAQIAQYCAYYARRMKQSLLNYLHGRRKSILGYPEYIGDFYPHHSDEENEALHDVAEEAWKNMFFGCKGCEQMCLQDYSSRSTLFDQYKE